MRQYPESHQDNYAEVIAHMTPEELMELERIQGGRHMDDRNQLPSLAPLGQLIQSAQARPQLEEWERNGFAGGGEVEGINQFMRSSGRYGDTHAVVLPRPVADLFDKALYGGPQQGNPHTGKREYFLGALLGGLGRALIPALAPVVAPMLGKLAGSGLGAIGKMFGIGGSEAAGQKMGGALGQMGSQMATGMAGGQNWRQALGSSVGPAIQGQFGNNMYTQGLGQAAQSYGSGMPMGQSAMSGLQQGSQYAPQPWMREMGSAGANFGQNMMQGQSPEQSAYGAMGQMNPQSFGRYAPFAGAGQQFAQSRMQGQGFMPSVNMGMTRGMDMYRNQMGGDQGGQNQMIPYYGQGRY